MWRLQLVLPEEKEPWRGAESVSLCKLGAVTGYEKTVYPKFTFLDYQIRSSSSAKV